MAGEGVTGSDKRAIPVDVDKSMDWKKLQTDMVTELISERLHLAIARRHPKQLEQAIAEAEAAGVDPDDTCLIKAHSTLKIITRKKKLKDQIHPGNLMSLKEEIASIKSDRYLMLQMRREVQEAERYAEGLERLLKMKHSILCMDNRTMCEIRRYHKPPEVVHKVLQATLLLLGEEEETTKLWSKCQALMRPTGPRSLNKLILHFDVEKVHPEVIGRVRQILDEYQLEKVQPVSKGTATFYVWTMAMVEEFEKNHGVSSEVALSEDRQRELLGKPPRHRTPVRRRVTYADIAKRKQQSERKQ